MKELIDYKQYGLDYKNGKVKKVQGENYIKSGRVTIFDNGDVYLDDINLEESGSPTIFLASLKKKIIKEIEYYYETSEYRKFSLIIGTTQEYILYNNKSLRRWLNENLTIVHNRTDIKATPERRETVKKMVAKKADGTVSIIFLTSKNIDKIFEFLKKDKIEMFINKNLAIQEIQETDNLEELESYDYEATLNEGLHKSVNISLVSSKQEKKQTLKDYKIKRGIK